MARRPFIYHANSAWPPGGLMGVDIFCDNKLNARLTVSPIVLNKVSELKLAFHFRLSDLEYSFSAALSAARSASATQKRVFAQENR
jgi:hypothetical protein